MTDSIVHQPITLSGTMIIFYSKKVIYYFNDLCGKFRLSFFVTLVLLNISESSTIVRYSYALVRTVIIMIILDQKLTIFGFEFVTTEFDCI